MEKLKDKLKELYHESFKGRVRIMLIDPQLGISLTEWFYLSSVHLSDVIGYLDFEVINEDLCKTSFDPADHECQLTVRI